MGLLLVLICGLPPRTKRESWRQFGVAGHHKNVRQLPELEGHYPLRVTTLIERSVVSGRKTALLRGGAVFRRFVRPVFSAS